MCYVRGLGKLDAKYCGVVVTREMLFTLWGGCAEEVGAAGKLSSGYEVASFHHDLLIKLGVKVVGFSNKTNLILLSAHPMPNSEGWTFTGQEAQKDHQTSNIFFFARLYPQLSGF